MFVSLNCVELFTGIMLCFLWLVLLFFNHFPSWSNICVYVIKDQKCLTYHTVKENPKLTFQTTTADNANINAKKSGIESRFCWQVSALQQSYKACFGCKLKIQWIKKIPLPRLLLDPLVRVIMCLWLVYLEYQTVQLWPLIMTVIFSFLLHLKSHFL